jgi:membrane-associated phospholipid phosphatase
MSHTLILYAAGHLREEVLSAMNLTCSARHHDSTKTQEMHRCTVGLTLAVVLLLVAPSVWAGLDQGKQPTDDYPSDVAWVWFDTLYEVVKSEAAAPPPASRTYGVSAVALYEAVIPGTLYHRSLAGQLNDLASVPQPKKHRKHHWPTVANAALARTIRGLFPSLKPENLEAINALEQRFAAQFQVEVKRREYKRSVAHGQAVADAILAWAATDGFPTVNNCPYVPNPVPGAWERTPPGFAPNPLQPCWGQLRPMVLASGAECAPPGHPDFSTDAGSEFYAAALEVYHTGLTLTEEQQTIAEYWADGAGATGTPSGHWIALVGQIARNDGLSLAAAAEAYARVGIAVADAFIACWYTKYLTNLQRPVTYIQDHIDGTWLPHIVTPSFPTYTSGHSTQSGAAAAVLTDLFGSKAFTDTTHSDHHLMPPQEPRSFSSFDEAAAEAAVSRLYGGIHFSFDNHDGLAAGRCIGQAIIDHVRFKGGDND